MKNSQRNVSCRPEASGSDFKAEQENVQELGQKVPVGSADYLAPKSLKKALEYRSRYGYKAVVIAGGTDIMVDYFERLSEVTSWLDLTKIQELKEIKFDPEEIRLGSMVTHRKLATDSRIRKNLPLLAESASEVGAWQIQSRGTLGGNIVTSSPAGDTLAPLLAYQARFVLGSVSGQREVAAEDFFTGPKENIMTQEELLTEVVIPAPRKRTLSRWQKVGKRKAMIISSLTMALLLELDDKDEITAARAAYGAVAPTPIRAGELEDYLTGRKLREVSAGKAGELAVQEISPITDIRGTVAYRRQVTRDITEQALLDLQQE